jgi:hypothetical protein
MKTTQEIDKTLYQSPTDYPEMSGGGDVIEDTLNILGDNISTESQDVLFGAECRALTGTQIGVCCKGNEPCLAHTSDCPSDCRTDRVLPVQDISCLGDTPECILLSGGCPLDGVCLSDCTTHCELNCTNNVVDCTPLIGCPGNNMSKSPEISTDAFLYTKFGVGTNGGALCTTKSRAISLGLSVSGSTNYADAQLLPKNVIMGPTAATMNIQMDIYLNNTAFIVNKTRYSTSGTSYLVPDSYSQGGTGRASQYIAEVGNNKIFRITSLSTNIAFATATGYGSFRTDNSMGTANGEYTVGQYSGSLKLGTYTQSNISTKRTTGFSFSLELKTTSDGTKSGPAYVVSSKGRASLIATAINIDITPTGVNWSSSQPGGCSGRVTEKSFTINNGVGTFKGTMYIDNLVF